jgi:hypothetical protein
MYFAAQAGRAWAVYLQQESHHGEVAIDYFRAEASARHAAGVLNRGAAIVEAHRPLGCRIQPVAASGRPAAA